MLINVRGWARAQQTDVSSRSCSIGGVAVANCGMHSPCCRCEERDRTLDNFLLDRFVVGTSLWNILMNLSGSLSFSGMFVEMKRVTCPIEKQGDQIREVHARNQKAIVLVEDFGHDKIAMYKTHVVHNVEGSACCHAGTIFHCIGARPAGRRRGSCSCMQCAALRGRGMTEARLFLFMSEAQ